MKIHFVIHTVKYFIVVIHPSDHPSKNIILVQTGYLLYCHYYSIVTGISKVHTHEKWMLLGKACVL